MSILKADTKHHNNRLFKMFCICFFLFLCFSCGLDTNYYLDEPRSSGHRVDYTTVDKTQHYFSFITSETGNNAGFSGSTFDFKGTEIYYKIYSDAPTMTSREATVDNSNVANAVNLLITTYGYQTLKFSSGSAPTPIIQATDSNKYVYLRLTDYDTENSNNYKNTLQVANFSMSSYNQVQTIGYPRRNIDSSFGFDFGKTSNSSAYCKSPLPRAGDADFCGTQTDTGPWYIDVYAVSYGLDTVSNTNSYSSVVRLGSITVEKYSD